jgi:hypothetical protein
MATTLRQGDPCPRCEVPVYASARVSVPGGVFRILISAIKSVLTVARGGVGSVTIGEFPDKPVEADCINCGAVYTVEPGPMRPPEAA